MPKGRSILVYIRIKGAPMPFVIFTITGKCCCVIAILFVDHYIETVFFYDMLVMEYLYAINIYIGVVIQN